MILADESGSLRLILCFLNLFVNHGLRDYLTTSLPSLTSYLSSRALLDGNLTTLGPSSTERFPHLPFNRSRDSAIGLLLHRTTVPTTILGEESLIDVYILREEDGWSPFVYGVVLSIIHWTWTVSLISAALLFKPKRTTKWFLVGTLIFSGLIALVINVESNPSPFYIGGNRALLGLSQGFTYLLTYNILHNLHIDKFVVPYFAIFLAPWLGSAVGLIIGSAVEQQPFLGSNIFAGLCFLLAIFSIFLPISGLKFDYEPNVLWNEILRSLPVWSCVVVHLAGVWVLHTFVVGTTLTLFFKINKGNLLWTISVLVLVGGLALRAIALSAKSLMRTKFLSALNRRRIIVISGSLIAIAAIVVNGTAGLDSGWILCFSSLIGICGGVGFCIVGARLNLHDMAPSYPIPSLIFASCGAGIGAGIASLLFPSLAQIGNLDNTLSEDSGPYQVAWMVPIAVLTGAAILHAFVLSVNPLPHQTSTKELNGSVPKQNGVINKVSLVRTASDLNDFDSKSFKSVFSAASFKTAVSRPQTGSFKTVDEDFQEVDLKSIADSDEARSVKTAIDDNEEADLKSIKSGTSFRSAADDYNRRSVVLDVSKMTQTQDWLQTAQNTGKEDKQKISTQKRMVERNVLMAVQW